MSDSETRSEDSYDATSLQSKSKKTEAKNNKEENKGKARK